MNAVDLDRIELDALESLIASGRGGNATAASQALLAVQRIREKCPSVIHRSKLEELSKDGSGMAEYLATLGLSVAEVEQRMGRKLCPGEAKAWQRGQDDRLLEVRAVELQRMRSSGDIPRWASRKNG